jgi:hypothetical protein
MVFKYIYLEVGNGLEVAKFIHGLSFGGTKFSFFPKFRVKCECGARGTLTF